MKEKTEIIGLDHGYGNVKTAHCCFPTGVIHHKTEPTFKSNLLIFEGEFYTIGEGHKEFLAKKQTDMDFYLLTLAAVGRELYARNLRTAQVYLAAGLPLTWVSEQKAAFQAYLLQKSHVDFTFKGVDFSMDFVGADIFPQGFAAVPDVVKEGCSRGKQLLLVLGIQHLRRPRNQPEKIRFDLLQQGGWIRIVLIEGGTVHIRPLAERRDRDAGQLRMLQELQQGFLQQAPGHLDPSVLIMF